MSFKEKFIFKFWSTKQVWPTTLEVSVQSKDSVLGYRLDFGALFFFFHLTVDFVIYTWSYGSSLSNYLCNQCISQLMLWVRTMWGILDTKLCDKVCPWLATGQWFSLDPLVSSNNKTDSHDLTEILLKVALNTKNQTKSTCIIYVWFVPGSYYFDTFIIVNL
jgi:hypothetical protein